jgi:hypothetical protein
LNQHITEPPALDAETEYRVSEAIAKQIEVEQGLVATRLNWNLTFQGFMVASYALVATADASAPARNFIHVTITLVGFVVALATLMGILASSRQSTYLKQHWDNIFSKGTIYPRPFSSGDGSKLGRIPSRALCGALMFMWLVLLAAGSGLVPTA